MAVGTEIYFTDLMSFCPNWDHISARMNYEERGPSCGTRAVPAGQGNQPHNKIKVTFKKSETTGQKKETSL